MKIETLACGAFMTNTYLISEGDKAIIIDPTMGLNRKSNIINKYEIVGVYLTHGHIDHIASVNMFNCPIYIYKDEKNLLYNNSLNLSSMFGFPFELENDNIVLVNENSKLSFEGHEIKIIHTPGHTKGSICILIEDNLFSGDTLFQMSMGRVDFPTGSNNEMYQSLIKLVDNLDQNIKVYPGHGCDTTILDEKQNPYYLLAKKAI